MEGPENMWHFSRVLEIRMKWIRVTEANIRIFVITNKNFIKSYVVVYEKGQDGANLIKLIHYKNIL